MDYADLKRWKRICSRMRNAPGDDYEDLAVFSELVRNAFPGDAPLRQEFEKVYKEFMGLEGNMGEGAEQKRSKIIERFRQIVASTERILSSGVISPTLEDASALAGVDRVFFRSKLFYFAATMLVLAGILLGLISFGHTWLSVSAFQRLEQTRKELDTTTQEMEDLKLESRQVIDGLRSDLDTIFKDNVREISDHTETIKTNLQDNTLPEATRRIASAADEIITNNLETTKNAEVSRIEAEVQRVLDTDVNKWINAASVDLNEEKQRVMNDMEQVKLELDELLTDAGQAKVDFDKTAEGTFKRWEDRLKVGVSELAMLTEKSDGLGVEVVTLAKELMALQNSSTHALEVAGELEAGTSTGRLDLIGAALEQAALAVLVAVGLSAISLAIGTVALYRTRRQSAAIQ